jgi:hypothetical protein
MLFGLIILTGLTCLVLGFFLGLRQARRLLPTFLARMTPEELKEVAKEASEQV